MNLLDNVIMMMFLSFVVGVIFDPVLRRVADYERLSSKYAFRNLRTYEVIGVLWFRRFLIWTPFGSFNRDIRFTSKRDLDEFRSIRDCMATAEMSHWIAFAAMLLLTFVAWWFRGPIVGLAYVFFNIVGNVYPALLQQYNKRRLCRLILVAQKRGQLEPDAVA